jgi:FAT domain
MWASGSKDERGSKEDCLNFLRSFSESLSKDLEAEMAPRGQRSNVSKQRLEELSRLLARCYFKQGEWQMELSDSWDTVRESLAFPPALTHSSAHSGTSKTSFIRTSVQHISIPIGTKHGTPGLWPILKWSTTFSTKPKRKLISWVPLWFRTSFLQSKVGIILQGHGQTDQTSVSRFLPLHRFTECEFPTGYSQAFDPLVQIWRSR